MSAKVAGTLKPAALTGPELTIPSALRVKRQPNDADHNSTTDASFNCRENVSSAQAVKAEENSFKMEPDNSFSVKEVERITEDLLIEHLRDVTYDAMKCKQLSQDLAALLMDRVKSLRIKHYKLVAVVSIGSINERPGMQFGSRCLWNNNTDSFASVKFTNGSLFAVAMVYGLYFE